MAKKRQNPAKPMRIEVPSTFVPPKTNAQMTPAYMEIYPDKKGNKA
jgi:hypothetical protein